MIARVKTLACQVAAAAAVILLLVMPTRAETLGPLDPDAEQGSFPISYWFTGVSGAGFVSTHDSSNPYTGSYNFKVGNTAASTPFTGGNYGDFRSPVFLLGPASRGNQPINFSFAFELPGVVNAGDDMLAELIFYERAGNNGDGDGYVGEYGVQLGSTSGNSAMTGYSVFSHGGIIAPSTADFAAVRFTANIFVPWSSGTAYFDTISVTTAPTPVPEIDPTSMGSALALCGGILAFIEQRRRATGA